MCRLSLVVVSGSSLHCDAQASHCGGLACCKAQALGVKSSVVAARGLSSRGLRALEQGLSTWGTGA